MKIIQTYSISGDRVDTIQCLEKNMWQLLRMAWWADAVVDLTQVSDM